MSYGLTRNLPNSAQRQAMVIPLLGPSDGLRTAANSQSTFRTLRKKFVDSCIGLAEHATGVEENLLEEQVRSSAINFHAFLYQLHGKSFKMSAQQVGALFDTAL